MPNINSNPPNYVRTDLTALRQHLDATLPAKTNNPNVLIATWNIRCFGDLTEKWRSGSNDSPKRNLHALLCIAEIISRFDVVAIQEVRGNIKALRHTLKRLGNNWGFLMTDVTRGGLGNNERLAFLYDTTRVKPSGLACELVLPEELEEQPVVSANAFQHQFARTPYAVSFTFSGTTFILTTLHVHYGSNPDAHRIPELTAIANWLADWASKSKAFGHNFLALGDFNIDRHGDDLYDAFVSTGLYTPDDLNHVPSTIFAKPNKPQLDKHYDQIAWFNGNNNVPSLNITYRQGGFVDFRNVVMSSLTNNSLSWRMSDHFPLWAEFAV